MAKLSVGVLLCFVLLGFSSATELQYDFNNDVDLETFNPQEYAMKVNINKFIDGNVKILRGLLKKVDPMRLLRIPLLGKGSLSNGKLNNLSQFYRTDDCTIQYENRVLSVDLNVGWNDINMHYDYDFKLWLIQRYGTVDAGIKSLKINLSVGIDLRRYRIVLKSLKFYEVGKFGLKIEGTPGDKIRTFFWKLILNLAKKQVVSNIEEATVNTLRTLVDQVNEELPSQSRKFTFSYPISARQLDIDAFESMENEIPSDEDLMIY